MLELARLRALCLGGAKLPDVFILRAGLYVAGGACGRFGMAVCSGGGPPLGIPRGPCGLELGIDSVSREVRAA